MGKVTTACNPCAVRKIKCTGVKPCPACLKSGFDCTFSIHSKRGPKGPRPATRARIDKNLLGGQPSPELESSNYSGRTYSDQASVEYQHSPGYGPISLDSATHLVIGRSSFGSDRDSGYVTSNSISAPGPPCVIGESDVGLDEVAAYFHLYHVALYPIWPVVDHVALLRKLQLSPHDSEACTLAFALCSAVTARLRIDSPQDAPNTSPELATSRRFVQLAETHRAMYNYRAKASISSILIPFFLHVHYDCQCRVFMDSLLLREAITVAQLMNIDKISGYPEEISPQDQAHRRKIFWLLFLSEKGCAMMRDFPTSLQPGLLLPDPQFEPNPNLIMAFIALVKLFTAVTDVFGSGNVLIGGSRSSEVLSTQRFTADFFVQLQDALGQRPDVGPQTHDAQKADILLTQQWLQVLVWRFAVSRVELSTKSTERTLSFTFPAEIAKHTMTTLRMLPFEAIVAHGRGMEQKIFEIASTLLDVINVLPSESFHGSNPFHITAPSPTFGRGADLPTPSTTTATSMESPISTYSGTIGQAETPVSLLHSLSSILSIIGGRHSPYVALLQKKIAESRVLMTSSNVGLHAASPAPSSTGTVDDVERYRISWDTARRRPWDVATNVSTPPPSESAGPNWTVLGQHGIVQANPMAHTSPLPPPLDRKPLQRNNSHWPIDTEMLGTMSDPKYLDGWRGSALMDNRQFPQGGTGAP